MSARPGSIRRRRGQSSRRQSPAYPRDVEGTTADALPVTPTGGLTADEVARRRASGLGNAALPPTSRTYVQIVRENVFTFINNILIALALALVLVARPVDALVSLLVISTNVVVGVVQEVRAKRTLDRIALLTRPTASVVRDGKASADHRPPCRTAPAAL